MRNTPENPNEPLLLKAVEKLAPFMDRIAFVGGCATGLLVTDPGTDPVRRTLGLQNAQRVRIGDYEVRLITAPYFLATKFEAFHGRGKSDHRTSHDLEDIITVVDGRPELAGEVRLAPLDLQKYLSDEFEALLSNPHFIDALPGFLYV